MTRQVLQCIGMLAVATIAGCASAPSGQTADPDSAIALGRALAVQQAKSGEGTEGLIGGALQSMKTSVATPNNKGSYLQNRQWWCQPKGMTDPWGQVRAEFNGLCGRRGGTYENGFCSKASDHDQVIFMAKVARRNDGCAQVHLAMLEPTGAVDDPAYRAALASEGFVTSAQLQERQRKAQADALIEGEKMRQQQRQREAEYASQLPGMRTVGAKVCRSDQTNTLVGYVENVSQDKLQIRVAQAYVTRTPSLQPGGFQAHIIWDYPARWRLCD